MKTLPTLPKAYKAQHVFDLLQKGNPLALQFIHMQYQKRLFWIGRRILKDDFVLETLVQDVFLKLWENREKIEEPEHIFFFLRFVLKRDCITYYTKPKNVFFRNLNSLENFENYQDYLYGFDPMVEKELLREQETEQINYEEVQKVIPFLSSRKQQLIQLCLKYGFRYKEIATVMGTSITQSSKDVRKAIAEIQAILLLPGSEEVSNDISFDIASRRIISQQQKTILELRLHKNLSFEEIAAHLNLSTRVVSKEFMVAYHSQSSSIKSSSHA